MVEAQSNEILDSTLDSAGTDLKILGDKVLIVHHAEALG
jgi:hypothetical protein